MVSPESGHAILITCSVCKPVHYSYGCDAPPSDSEQIKVYKSEVLKGQCAVYEAIKFFVYIQIYVMYYYISSMEMVESNA